MSDALNLSSVKASQFSGVYVRSEDVEYRKQVASVLSEFREGITTQDLLALAPKSCSAGSRSLFDRPNAVDKGRSSTELVVVIFPFSSPPSTHFWLVSPWVPKPNQRQVL